MRCQYIVISQYKKIDHVLALRPLQHHRRVAHAYMNTYTGPYVDVMLCAMPNVYGLSGGNQADVTTGHGGVLVAMVTPAVAQLP